MGGLSIWHWLVVGVIILLLFGKGRFSDMMGDVAKGLKSFKKGMSEEDEPTAARTVEPQRRLPDERPGLSADPEPVRDLDRREP
ncbi:MAG TPA: twin-arginine translocase TatA/TatE family subunit [Allosphingosinicella sp.]